MNDFYNDLFDDEETEAIYDYTEPCTECGITIHPDYGGIEYRGGLFCSEECLSDHKGHNFYY